MVAKEPLPTDVFCLAQMGCFTYKCVFLVSLKVEDLAAWACFPYGPNDCS